MFSPKIFAGFVVAGLLLNSCSRTGDTTTGPESSATSSTPVADMEVLPAEEGWSLSGVEEPLPTVANPVTESELRAARSEPLPAVTPPPPDAWVNRSARRLRPGLE